MSDQNQRPIVSLIIPVYNGANFLAPAIESALNQTYSPLEIIVVNDGSNDDGKTEAIALSFGNRIRYLVKPNGGVGDALNFAITRAKGDFFSWLSHDDLYHPNKVAAQVEYARSVQKPVIVYSDFEFIDSSGNVLGQRVIPHFLPGQFRASFLLHHTINGCALLIPMECFRTVAFFDPALKHTQDYDLWFKFSGSYEFHHLPGVLVQSRQHPGQDTNRMPQRVVNENNVLYSGFINSISDSDVEALREGSVALYYSRLVRMMCKMGYDQAWRTAAAKAIRTVAALNFRELPEFGAAFAYAIAASVYRTMKRVFR